MGAINRNERSSYLRRVNHRSMRIGLLSAVQAPAGARYCPYSASKTRDGCQVTMAAATMEAGWEFAGTRQEFWDT